MGSRYTVASVGLQSLGVPAAAPTEAATSGELATPQHSHRTPPQPAPSRAPSASALVLEGPNPRASVFLGQRPWASGKRVLSP